MNTNTGLFLESIIHSNHKVYGYNLLPLSLFHLSLLEHYKSPLFVGGKLKAQDINLAACICSSKNMDELNKKLGSKIKPLLSYFYKPVKELRKWESYYADVMSFPEMLDGDGKGKVSPLPLSLTLAGNLIKNTGWQWDYVFYDLPVSQIIWMNTVFGYLETGDTLVIGDEHRKGEKFLMELQAKEKALKDLTGGTK